jgi:hypothetical protein
MAGATKSNRCRCVQVRAGACRYVHPKFPGVCVMAWMGTIRTWISGPDRAGGLGLNGGRADTFYSCTRAEALWLLGKPVCFSQGEAGKRTNMEP